MLKHKTIIKSKTTFLILLSVGLFLATVGVFLKPVRAIIWIGGHINSNTTWTPVDTYRVINDTYVDPNVTLTILPDVHVQIADGFSLLVQGSLNATGTEAQPIIFTSSQGSPNPGAWNTIEFDGNSSEQFFVRNAKVEYAVLGMTVGGSGKATVEKSEFVNCSQAGIMVKGSNVVIGKNSIHHNKNGVTTDTSYAPHNVSGISIVDNTISFNQGDGIYLYSYGDNDAYVYNVTILSNNVTSNGGSGIHLSSEANYNNAYIHDAILSSNTILSNGGFGIYLRSDSFSSFIYNVVISYNVISDCPVQHAIHLYCNSYYGASIYNVTILSNTALFNGFCGIDFYVFQQATGGSIHDVVVSSNTVLSNLGWGVSLGATGGSIFNVVIASNTVSSNNLGGIFANAQDHGMSMFGLELDNNTVSANNQQGICISGGVNANLTHNSVSYNPFGVFYDETQENQASYNDIYNNSYGMNVAGGATVNAEYNYWGHSTGPYHQSLNPEGEGNPVNGNGIDLDFIPFLTSPVGTINQRPVAILEADKTNPNVGETVTFDASGSTDDGRIHYYFFDFGDGINIGWTPLSVVTHKYASEGTYNATLIVMDDFGVTSLNGNLIYVEITVVPEFPSFLILPLFMIATLVIAVYAKKRKRESD